MHKCPLDDLLMTQDQNLHTQTIPGPPFSEPVSCEEAYSLAKPSQNDYLTFFLFTITFPHGPHASACPASLLNKNLRAPSLLGSISEISPVSSLGWLIKLSSAADLLISVFGLLRAPLVAQW